MLARPFGAAVLLAAGSLVARSQETVNIDVTTNVLQLSASNAIELGPGVGNFTMDATGDPHYGAPSSAVWNDVVWQTLDSTGGITYTSVPIGGSATVYATHLAYAFLTDSLGTLWDNSGQANLSVLNSLNEVVGHGTILANTNVAQFTDSTALPFLTSGSLMNYEVDASGLAYYGGSSTATYDSVCVQYLDASGAINYAAVPVGGSIDIFGQDVRAFVTDAAGTLGDNSGTLHVTLRPRDGSTPEPFTAGLGLAGVGLFVRRRIARKRRTCRDLQD